MKLSKWQDRLNKIAKQLGRYDALWELDYETYMDIFKAEWDNFETDYLIQIHLPHLIQ